MIMIMVLGNQKTRLQMEKRLSPWWCLHRTQVGIKWHCKKISHTDILFCSKTLNFSISFIFFMKIENAYADISGPINLLWQKCTRNYTTRKLYFFPHPKLILLVQTYNKNNKLAESRELNLLLQQLEYFSSRGLLNNFSWQINKMMSRRSLEPQLLYNILQNKCYCYKNKFKCFELHILKYLDDTLAVIEEKCKWQNPQFNL